MPRKSKGQYPKDWPEIAERVKEEAKWKCIRCGHAHEPKAGFTLTVHHLDMDPSNNAWWNLAALCQRCHLTVQSKVKMERPWMFEHTKWIRPFVAGFYAHMLGYPEQRWYVETFQEVLIAMGQSRNE